MAAFVFLVFAVVLVVVCVVFMIRYARQLERDNEEYLIECYELAYRTENSRFYGDTQAALNLMSRSNTSLQQ